MLEKKYAVMIREYLYENHLLQKNEWQVNGSSSKFQPIFQGKETKNYHLVLLVPPTLPRYHDISSTYDNLL